MAKIKKTLIISISSILITLSLIFVSYYAYFYPKVPVTPINSPITSKNTDILKKISLDKFSLSLKNKSLKSTITLNDNDLTDLTIMALKDHNTISKYVTGVKVYIQNQYISLYCNLDYKGIPFSAKFNFTLDAKDGTAILHYDKGKVGFLPILKEMIFSKLQDTPIIKYNKNTGNIILHLENIKGFAKLTILDATVDNENVYLTINASLTRK